MATDIPGLNKGIQLKLPFHLPRFTLSSLQVAPKLLGAILTRKLGSEILSGKIVEVEAYGGPRDESSHAFGGKRIRNAPMFETGGIFYVYFTYGNHFCLNIVTGREGDGEAVLIRAIEPIEGTERMAMNRFSKTALSPREHIGLSNGPGKLCKAMAITKEQNALRVSSAGLYLSPGQKIKKSEIVTTTRIGISKSKDFPWRFFIADNPFVSRI